MKKILSLVLLLALSLSLCTLLFSCKNKDGGNGEDEQDGGDNADTKVTYTVTVKDSDGDPVKGIEVKFKPEGASLVPIKTDSTGKAIYTTKHKITATIDSIPVKYEYEDLEKPLTFDENGNASVTLQKRAPFVIKVVDDEGNALSGITVQMCNDSGFCKIPQETDENGEVFYEYEEGVFHAQLTVPEDKTVTDLYPGYTVEDSAAYYDFDGNRVTIVLEKVAE